MSNILLGCIADDFTGATDLANNLVRAGMRVVQTNGIPNQTLSLDVDAVVVALKSRTIAPEDAIEQSLQALKWLKSIGSQQIYFKYCSTFDSAAVGVEHEVSPTHADEKRQSGSSHASAMPTQSWTD